MNRYLDISIRTAVLAVVASPIFMWGYMASQLTFSKQVPCTSSEYNCRIDRLDAHTTP